MKQVVAIVLICILCTSFIYNPNEVALSISQIKNEYKSGESIHFQVTNTTDKDLYVSYRLWQWFEKEKEWVDIVPDLLNYNCDRMKMFQGVTYNIFYARQSKTVVWNPKKVNQKTCFNWKHRPLGMYRIEARFNRDKDAETETVYSSTFNIN
jgi:hypothetical protein